MTEGPQTREAYADAVERLIEGPTMRVRWLELYDVLRPREGWYFQVDENAGGVSSPLFWCFGLAGECRLAVTIPGTFIVLYVYDRDDEIPLDTPEELVAWLDENEHQWEGLSPLGQELMDHLLPGQVERWKQEGEEPESPI